MFNEKRAQDFIYLSFKDFMHKEKVSEIDKTWIYAQVTFARSIDILSDKECKMMCDSIKERKVY